MDLIIVILLVFCFVRHFGKEIVIKSARVSKELCNCLRLVCGLYTAINILSASVLIKFYS